MSGYRTAPAVLLLDANNRPIGFKEIDGDETYFPTLSQDQSTLVNLDGNPMRVKPPPPTPGGIICDWQATSGAWTLTSANVGEVVPTPDPTVMIDGFPAVKCVFAAAVGTYSAKFVFTNPVSFAKFKTAQIPVVITGSDVTSGLSSFQVFAIFSDGTSAKFQIPLNDIVPGKVHPMSFSRYATATTSGGITFSTATMATFDTLTVTEMRIIMTAGVNSATYPVWVGPVRLDARSVGRVSIVMDGEYSSQYAIIKPLFDANGLKASLAITTADIGAGGRMTEAQIDQFYKEGHEIIHHTFDSTKVNGYINATDWPSAAVIAKDVRSQWEYMRSKGWTRGIGKAVTGFFSSFSGIAGTTAARQRLVMEALRAGGAECLRSSPAMDKQQMSIGNKGVPPYMLRGSIQATSTDTAASIMAVIDQAEDNGEWAIITLHRAVADSVAPGSLEMQTTALKTAIDYAGARHRAGGVIVAPMGEVFDQCFK